MKLKKTIIGLLALTAGSSMLLVGCSEQGDAKETLAKTEKAKKGKKYNLAFFENKATNSASTQYYELGYYKNARLVQKQLASDWIDDRGHVNHNDYYQEIVDPDVKTPYVIIKDGKYYIHRPPYTQYNQPLIKGKVTAKEGK